MINVLIVDDEKNIREGIIALIDWESLGAKVVGSCVNGKVALEFIDENSVDVVVTDIKMPIMDGLTLCKKVKEDYKDIEVIILTAFSEFEMARTALKFNVVDYIIKNDFMDELPNAILKCRDRIAEKERTKEEQSFSIDDDDMFFGIIKSLSLSNDIPEETIKKYGLNNYNYCICACHVNSYEVSDTTRDVGDVLNNMLKISLSGCRYTMMSISEKLYLIGVCYEKKSELDIHRVVGYFSNILIMVEEFMRVEVKLGLSTEKAGVRDLKEGYREATDALSKLVDKGCQLKVYDGNLYSKSGEFVDISWYSEKITEAAFDEKVDKTDELIEGFGKLLAESECSFNQCRLYSLVIFSTLIHKAVRYQLNTDMDFNEYEQIVYKKVMASNTILELRQVGLETIGEIRGLCIGKKNTKNELVTKVDECIRESYKDDLTLQSISNQLFLNNSYISRTYKKMTGMTVTEAITLYRVSKAKELLINSNMKIYEIAQNIGFNDAAYFTNVFIKYEKISPSEYRQMK